jgi:hypothetical protein
MAFEIGIMTFGELTEDLASGALPSPLGTEVAPVVRREVAAREQRAA